jgi:transcriptional regulator GlxA family with amidase domain
MELIKPRSKTVTSETEEKIQAIEEFISERFREPLTRESLAEAVQMSPDHLGRMYLKLTGEKLSATINRLRIDYACRKLIENDIRIIDIAYESGFESLRTFNKHFSLIKGKTPKEFRESN